MANDATPTAIRFAHSQADFEKLVTSLEFGAPTLDRLAQRMFVVFKDDKTNVAIAERFIEESQRELYLREQRVRRAKFYEAMEHGSQVCREVYSCEELLAYAHERRHGPVVLSPDRVRSTFENWKTALRKYPANYQARITADLIPIKYSIGNGIAMIHQGAQIPSQDRLKGFVLTDEAAVDHFVRDFNMIWNDATESAHGNDSTIAWVDERLIPLLESSTAELGADQRRQ